MQKPDSVAEAYEIAYGSHGLNHNPAEVEAIASELFEAADFVDNPYKAEDYYVMSSALRGYVDRLRAAQEPYLQSVKHQAIVHDIGSRSVETSLSIAA